MKESATTSYVRLEAAKLGDTLWRNNSGGFYDETGRFVRYGLGSFTDKDEKNLAIGSVSHLNLLHHRWLAQF